MTKIPIAAVVGATASGKTALAIELAERFNGEIVSADSMQIYKYMDIGTAKPTAEERKRAVHHLIDFVNPKDAFSAADYAQKAHECIADIISRKKFPIICGGTGLYVNSVIDDVKFAETECDEKYRAELSKIAEEKGDVFLHDMLKRVDKKSAENIHPNNVKRVIRALEFYEQTGMRLSDYKDKAKDNDSRYLPIMFETEWDRDVLYERINRRVDVMINDGLYDEVCRLKAMGISRDMQSMQGIGYKEMYDCTEGLLSLFDTAEKIKLASRRYAKRQLTWFRRDTRINRLKYGTDIVKTAAEILTEKCFF